MRTHWEVTRSVWHATFMREALARTTGDRFAWFWMLAEPIAFVVIMVLVRELLGRLRLIMGAEWIPWLVVGLVAFFLFREGVLRSMGAVEANRGLFAYRQVKPVDPVLVRNVLEGLLKTLVLFILIAGVALLGYDILPSDPLGAMFVWISIWLLGLGAGLVVSVVGALVPEVGRLVRMMMLPMFLLSGVIIPLQTLPHQVQVYVIYNPVVHGLESLRLSFFEGYKSLPGIDLTYLWLWSLSMIALGLALHLRFDMRLKAQ
ncbi:ABC 2 transport system integral membrane protein [Thioalkalivibrio sulfidiphilus HL-EbGr7]|uniref:Transport permease protein n=1 Tax=Thioalkalivibrio sulfidiphilus (strain HL-EbGR7) TaxID=396588 RepID=B8GQX2_THISH|nr:ABC transporter permease [Thioalkalivibrio sulfidiphilus]ACL72392.1 ABC 2 transport system integral membrane protein [Thioalkalivibrio sulfidiphilus HL-EbGr7]